MYQFTPSLHKLGRTGHRPIMDTGQNNVKVDHHFSRIPAVVGDTEISHRFR